MDKKSRRRLSGRLAPLAALCVMGALARPARAAEPDADKARDDRPVSLTLEGGLVAFTLSADAELQSRWGLVIGAGAGVNKGPAVNGYVGYHIPLGAGFALRPGVRAARLWQTNERCQGTCVFDSLTVEAAIRFQSRSGFVVSYGLPLLAWLPVGPDPGQTQPHLQSYTLSTGDTAFFGTLFFGHAF
jgi:hypothetical protein